MKNKKGDILDIMVLLITLTVFSIGLFIFAYVVPEITGGLSDAGMNNSAEGISAINTLYTFGVDGMQKGFFILFCGLIIGIMISSYFIKTHPIFLFLYIILLGISIILAVYLGNMYETFTNNPIFADRLADQTIINIVMNNIVQVILGVGALSLIIIFSKFAFGYSEPGGV